MSEDHPVLIIGGGLAGLATATFLGLRGVRAVLAERHPSTSIHPRARGQVPPTMEALRAAGIDQQVRDASPAEGLSVVIAESLAGPEIFAPIAPVVVVKDADEAVALANDTGYGLVNSVLTADLFRGGELARQLRAGMVHVNDATPQDEAAAPFGGIGQSGLGGRSGGDANLEEFTERRWLTLNPGPVHYPY